jgi:exopolysaccharide biosynthesis polyprenyl glycosylphosphotransferase
MSAFLTNAFVKYVLGNVNGNWGRCSRAVQCRCEMTTIDASTAFELNPPDAFRPIAAPRAALAPVIGARETTGAKTAAPLVAISPAVAPRVEPALERRRRWEQRYSQALRASDTLAVLLITVGVAIADSLIGDGGIGDLWAHERLPILSGVLWIVMLAMFGTRATTIVGSGSTEYVRVAHASGFAFGIVAIAFVAFQWPGARAQLMLALPIGLVALLANRWAWRRWLHRKRQFGHFTSRAIVTGTCDDIEYVIRQLDRAGRLGYVVVGVATTDAADGDLVVDGKTYERVGSTHTVAANARHLSADTIIVASRPDDDPDFIRRLSWQLEGTAAELILSSRLVDVAGPRISLRPIDGLPLIHVKIPQFEGGRHVLKRALDIAVATIALIPIALVTPLIALLIALDSRGPVFFRQVRIGRDGREFEMLKFRTMRVNAEAELVALNEQNEGSGPLFKLKCDPRVTRVGAVMRKFSLDELPQFWNVVRGDMSVVGPRPPLPAEVTSYDGRVFRRLYIKPGITGLWQISGRSDLSWDESVRLDLRYVENWSVMTDLMIMWRTAHVMIAPKGAY